jgi:hypothetical protein
MIGTDRARAVLCISALAKITPSVNATAPSTTHTKKYAVPQTVLSVPRRLSFVPQLIVYHFMFDPSWDAGCLHCSFWADNFNPVIVHMNHRAT